MRNWGRRRKTLFLRRQKPFYLEEKHLLLLRRKAGQQRQHFKIALIGNGGRGFFFQRVNSAAEAFCFFNFFVPSHNNGRGDLQCFCQGGDARAFHIGYIPRLPAGHSGLADAYGGCKLRLRYAERYSSCFNNIFDLHIITSKGCKGSVTQNLRFCNTPAQENEKNLRLRIDLR
nr:MAG TPA: hypothetical protein [Caudoviricetes sp.]